MISDRQVSISPYVDALLYYPTRSLAAFSKLALRGDTPIREEALEGCVPLHGYSFEEYEDLIGRGATRLMIQQFDMEFSDEEGIGKPLTLLPIFALLKFTCLIVAWADQALFEDFANKRMLPDARWKIHLGRQVTLEPGDADGSIFVEDLLEEAARSPHRWDTSYDGEFWVTQPMIYEDGEESETEGSDEDDDDDDDGDGGECAEEENRLAAPECMGHPKEKEKGDQDKGEGKENEAEAEHASDSESDPGPFPLEDEYEIDQLAEGDPEAQLLLDPSTGL